MRVLLAILLLAGLLAGCGGDTPGTAGDPEAGPRPNGPLADLDRTPEEIRTAAAGMDLAALQAVTAEYRERMGTLNVRIQALEAQGKAEIAAVDPRDSEGIKALKEKLEKERAPLVDEFGRLLRHLTIYVDAMKAKLPPKEEKRPEEDSPEPGSPGEKATEKHD
jgi:hypothetical protein